MNVFFLYSFFISLFYLHLCTFKILLVHRYPYCAKILHVHFLLAYKYATIYIFIVVLYPNILCEG